MFWNCSQKRPSASYVGSPNLTHLHEEAINSSLLKMYIVDNFQNTLHHRFS